MDITFLVSIMGGAFVAVGLGVYFLIVYNGLVGVRVNIDKAWANIDVLLKQRHEEVPNLVAICKEYAQYERTTLEKITQARSACISAAGVADASCKEANLSSLLHGVFAVAENYPDLKANNNFMQLQKRITEIEDMIADRRELYNESVTIYNTRIHQIPDLWVAGTMQLQDREMFKASEEEKAQKPYA